MSWSAFRPFRPQKNKRVQSVPWFPFWVGEALPLDGRSLISGLSGPCRTHRPHWYLEPESGVSRAMQRCWGRLRLARGPRPDQTSFCTLLWVHVGSDPNTIRKILPAVEAAVYLEGERGPRRRGETGARICCLRNCDGLGCQTRVHFGFAVQSGLFT